LEAIVKPIQIVFHYNEVNSFVFFWLYLQEGNIMRIHPLERGQGLLEYALIMVLVALAVIVVLALLGPTIGSLYSNIMPLI
jgi:pilus assembly protein Flp/PilA